MKTTATDKLTIEWWPTEQPVAYAATRARHQRQRSPRWRPA